LGAALSKWLGSGDYTLSQNSIVTRASSSVPDMHRTNQSIVVRHREFLGQISGSTAFQIQDSYTINPGLVHSFPWLSSIASSFQEYNIKGMVYHYVPTSGTAVPSTSAALGSVMFQTSYRSNDNPPTSKSEMLNEFWANETVPYETLAHPIECDPKENPFAIHYIRTGDIPSGEVLMYDIGTTYVATAGMQSASVIGDVWVTYEIEFKKPIVNSNVTSLGGYYARTFTGATTSDFFSTPAAEIGNLDIRTSSAPTGRIMTFNHCPVGDYIVQLVVPAATSFTGNAFWTTSMILVNCSKFVYDGVSQEQITDASSVTALNLMSITVGIRITSDVLASITFPTLTATGSVGRVSLVVYYIGPSQ
jgi:hypothetical protein